MRIEIDWENKPNPLVIVYFEEDSNFHSEDLSWVPRKTEISSLYKALKRAGAWE